jgi:hypothetical protein
VGDPPMAWLMPLIREAVVGLSELLIAYFICCRRGLDDVCMTYTQGRHDHSLKTIKGCCQQMTTDELLGNLLFVFHTVPPK